MKKSGGRSAVAFVGVVGPVLLVVWLLVGRAPAPAPAPAPLNRAAARAVAHAVEEPVGAPEGSLSGVVRGAEGKAIVKARVCATTVSSEVSWTPELSCAQTNEDGSYRVAPLGNTVYAVSAIAQGFLPGGPVRGREIFLARGEAKTGVDIVLGRGGSSLSGRVLDATGGPIAGATIRVLRRTIPHEATATKSEADGSFAVWTATGPVTVLAEASGYAPVRMAHVAPSRDLVLRLAPGSSLSGQVVAEKSGAPVPGVRVRAIAAGHWNDSTRPSATSDGAGAFDIRGLEPGRYTLVGEGTGWRGELNTPIDIGLAKGVEGVTLTVSAAAVVTGKVVWRGSDQACSRGSVTLGPVDSSTSVGHASPRPTSDVPMIVTNLEADGTARITVPAGSYQVEVECADSRLAEGPTTLEVGHDNIDGLVWKVDPGARVLVRVIDGVGQPAPNVQLFLREGPPPEGASSTGAPQRAGPLLSFITTRDGTYELTGLSPGLYTIEPGPAANGRPVAVDARTSDKVEATVRLEGRGWIVVSVRTPDGVGVDQVEVKATPVSEDAASPSPARNAKPVALGSPTPSASFVPRVGTAGSAVGDGRFEIGPLAEGSYRVTVIDGINPPREPSDWPAGVVRVGPTVARATIILERTGTLTGRVVDSSRQALPDVWVTADCAAFAGEGWRRAGGPILSPLAASRRVVSDAEGRFRIERVAADARCTLRATQPESGSVGVANDVRAGNDAVISIPDLGSLSGTAVAADGRPVTRFELSIRAPGGVARTATVSAPDGHWSLSRVVPGSLDLLADHPSLGDAQARVELAPGGKRDGVALQFRPPAVAEQR